jgi:hypothetical protein
METELEKSLLRMGGWEWVRKKKREEERVAGS